MKKNLFDAIGIKNIGYCYPPSKKDTIAVGYQNGTVWGTHQQHFKEAGGGPYWNLKGNGGLEASLNDMFVWINAITDKTILSQTTIDKMFSPHILEEGNSGQVYFGYGCTYRKAVAILN